MSENHLLCIGASSQSANYFIGRSLVDFNVYGLSSKEHKFIPSYRYEDFLKISKYKFKKIIIFSSGVPANCKTAHDYLKINDSVKKILITINLDQVDLTYISSYAVFNKNIDIITDHTECSPEDFYGESKVEMESHLISHYSKNVRMLNILRLPVFLYKGVRNNFMGGALNKIKNNQKIILSNPGSKFYSVFDDKSLFFINNQLGSGLNIVNCHSNGDIKFEEIGHLLECYGARNINWIDTERPSVKVFPSPNTKSIFEAISSKKIIEEWLISENN
jgi:nucleoside-diphosphate-sugar epimerase